MNVSSFFASIKNGNKISGFRFALVQNPSRLKALLTVAGCLSLLAGIFFGIMEMPVWLVDFITPITPKATCIPCEFSKYLYLIFIFFGTGMIIYAHFFLIETITLTLSKTKWWVLVLMIICIGFLLRVHLAGNTYFWQDEGESAIDTINLFPMVPRWGNIEGSP